MSYTPKQWEDYPSTATLVTADDLNRMEQGIADNDAAAAELQEITTDLKKDLDELITTSNSDLTNSASGSIASAKFVGYAKKEGNTLITPSGVVKSQNINLVDLSKLASGNSNLTVVDDKITIVAKTSTQYAGATVDFELKPNTTYTILAKSKKNVGSSDGYIRAEIYNGTTSLVEYWKTISQIPFTFTTPSNANKVRFGLYISQSAVCSANDSITFIKVMLAEGTLTDNAYTPYGHSEVNLPYIPLGVNSTKDELIVLADGSGKFIKRVERAKVNKGWTSTKTNTYLVGYLLTTKPRYVLASGANTSVIIDKDCGNYSYSQTDTPHYYFNNEEINAYFDKTKYTQDDLQTLDIIYEIEPQEITLTATEVEQILALKTFDNITYIDADGMEYTIGYYDNSVMGNALGGVSGRVANLGNEVAENKAELQSEIDAILNPQLKTNYYFNNCSIVYGGIFTIGKMVIVNVRLLAGHDGYCYMEGIPRPKVINSSMDLNISLVDIDTKEVMAGNITYTQMLYIPTVVAGHRYAIVTTYISE